MCSYDGVPTANDSTPRAQDGGGLRRASRRSESLYRRAERCIPCNARLLYSRDSFFSSYFVLACEGVVTEIRKIYCGIRAKEKSLLPLFSVGYVLKAFCCTPFQLRIEILAFKNIYIFFTWCLNIFFQILFFNATKIFACVKEVLCSFNSYYRCILAPYFLLKNG